MTTLATCDFCKHLNRDNFHETFGRGCCFQKIINDAWGDGPYPIIHKKCKGCRTRSNEIQNCTFCTNIPKHDTVNCEECKNIANNFKK